MTYYRPGDGTVRNEHGAIVGPDWGPLLAHEPNDPKHPDTIDRWFDADKDNT